MPFQISILSSRQGWINRYIPDFVDDLRQNGNTIAWVHDPSELKGGEICFYLSVEVLVPAQIRQKFTHNLVVHASALPQGKGWSPMTWQILDGSNEVTLSLFEAADKVDSGVIYAQRTIQLDGTELADEWREKQVRSTFELCIDFMNGYPQSVERARKQEGAETFYPRRTASDSQLDPQKPIAEQFDLLRVVDNDAYPAYFEYRGCRYVLKIGKEKL